jgi:hypothetical protein
MKNPRATLVATVVPLLLTSLPLAAGELPFNSPATERANESAPLLHETARALYDSSSAAALQTPRGRHISNLWLFPTADGETVFARYDLTSGEDVTSGGTVTKTEHLTVLTVRDNRIVESRELTSPTTKVASNEPSKLDWSATIGTGYTARGAETNTGVTGGPEGNANATGSSHVVSASPHWTASIGTGTAATTTGVTESKQPTSSGTQGVVAAAHWTSKIGSGHAFDSSERVAHESVANAR